MAAPSSNPPGDSAPADRSRANLALYRRYRSATFAEVIGQDHVTGPLCTALAAGRINHAYLFSGPRGCGKTSSARILARSLNCAQGPTPTPCGGCDSCRELAPNGPGSIDVIEIDAASHNGVDDARDLRERAYYSPVRDRYKVYIIDEAHMVTTNAFNALLKVIEEPPDFVVFVFATTEPDKVLQTIRSRTHHYPFRLVPPGVLRAHLERICAQEGVAVEQAVFPLVVRAGGGSVRDSLSLLDQLMAGSGPEGITYPRAVALLGVTDAALIDDMIDALAVGDAASVYGTVDRVVEAGHEPRRFAADLLDRLRDLLILDAVPEAADNGLLDAPADALARMRDQANWVGGGTAARFADIVHTALIEMRGTTAPRLLLELVCARMLLPEAGADAGALVQRLERLERGRQLAAPSATVAPATAVAEAPVAEAPVVAPVRPAAEVAPAGRPPAVVAPAAPAGELDVTAVRAIWPEVLDVVKRTSRRTRALLDSAQVARIEGTHVHLVMATAPLVRILGEPSNTDVVTAALAQLLPGRWTMQVGVEATGPPPAAPPRGRSARGPAATSAGQDAADVDPEVGDAGSHDAGDGTADDPDADAEDPGAGATGNSTAGSWPDVPAPRAPRDPETEALALLRDGLGARPIEG